MKLPILILCAVLLQALAYYLLRYQIDSTRFSEEAFYFFLASVIILGYVGGALHKRSKAKHRGHYCDKHLLPLECLACISEEADKPLDVVGKGDTLSVNQGIAPLHVVVGNLTEEEKAIAEEQQRIDEEEEPPPKGEDKETKLLRLAEEEDGCNISTGGLMSDPPEGGKEGLKEHNEWLESKKDRTVCPIHGPMAAQVGRADPDIDPGKTWDVIYYCPGCHEDYEGHP